MRALGRLRERASRRGAVRGAEAVFTAMGRGYARDAKRTGGVGEAWGRVCPDRLGRATRVLGLSRGVLRVGVPNDAVRHEVDRFLRDGGMRALAGASPATVRRVRFERVAIASLEAGGPG
jgi:hypothetical protein